MKRIIYGQIAARKRRLQRRLDKDNYPEDLSRPMIRGSTPQYELSGRASGTAYGGIGLIHQLVRDLGLAEAIDSRLHLFKVHLPYHESDHVLSLAYSPASPLSTLHPSAATPNPHTPHASTPNRPRASAALAPCAQLPRQNTRLSQRRTLI